MTNEPVPTHATESIDAPFRPRTPLSNSKRWAIAAMVVALVAGGVGTGCAITSMERDVVAPNDVAPPAIDARPTVPARLDAQGTEAPLPPPSGSAVHDPEPGPTARPFMHEGY